MSTDEVNLPRDLLVCDGSIYTMGPTSEPVNAALIRGGRVEAIGADALRLAGPTPRLSLEGRVAMPGLVDGHPHLLHMATRSAGYVDLSDVRCFDDIVQRFRARAAQVEPGEWLIGTPIGTPFYFIERWYTDLDERTMPGRDVLDAASAEHPIFIAAWAPRIPNVVAFNSLALSRLALTDHIPDRVCDVWLDKDRHGRLTGVLRGSVTNMYCFDPFWTQLLKKLPPMYPSDLVEPTAAAVKRYNADGITAVYEAHNMTPAHIGAYRALRAQGRLSMRVKAAMEVEQYAIPPFQPQSPEAFETSLQTALSLCDRGDDDWLRVTEATLSEGGPCWSGLLHTLEPYDNPYGQKTRGQAFIGREKKARFASFCACHGIRASWVNGGPGDHRDCIEALQALEAELNISDRGWMMQHGYVITPAQVEGYARLGMDFTTSMSFSWAKGDLIAERMGDRHLRDLVPLQRLLRSGMAVGLGSDWGPKNAPFRHVQLAQTHAFAGSGRRNDGADQLVTREQALRMWTSEVGRTLRWPGLGTLEPGGFGDLIVLDRNPFECSLDDLGDTKVLLTVLGGHVVHDMGLLCTQS